MSRTIQQIRRDYRNAMRGHARETGVDQEAAIGRGIEFINAVDAAGIPIRNVRWFKQPILLTDDGVLVQDLRTGSFAVHALAVHDGHLGAEHHRAHRAATPEQAIRQLRGPVARLTAANALLARNVDQRGMDMTTLYRTAMDQIVRLNPDPTAPARLEEGLALLGMLAEAGIEVVGVHLQHAEVEVTLPLGSIHQRKEGGYRICHAIMCKDSPSSRIIWDLRNGSYRTRSEVARDVATPADALARYVDVAVPKAIAAKDENNRAEAAKRASADAEASRQADVIARYEALSAEDQAIARLGVEYIEVAMRRMMGPLFPFARLLGMGDGGAVGLLDRIGRGGMPTADALIGMTGRRGEVSDVFGDAERLEAVGGAA